MLTRSIKLVLAVDEQAEDSEKVILPANCLVLFNGQKCQLRVNPESGVLVAYPVKGKSGVAVIDRTDRRSDDSM